MLHKPNNGGGVSKQKRAKGEIGTAFRYSGLPVPKGHRWVLARNVATSVAAILIAVACTLIAGCDSDSSDDTSNTQTNKPAGGGGGGSSGSGSSNTGTSDTGSGGLGGSGGSGGSGDTSTGGVTEEERGAASEASAQP